MVFISLPKLPLKQVFFIAEFKQLDANSFEPLQGGSSYGGKKIPGEGGKLQQCGGDW